MKPIGSEKKKVLIISISLIIWICSSSFVLGLDVTVKQSAVVRGDVVRLGDIAQFDPAEDSRVRQLSRMEISASPLPGSDTTINKDLLIYKINPYISGSKDILVKMPENLLIHRTAQFFDHERVQQAFVEYVKDHCGWPEEQILFEDINAQAPLALPEGKLRWEVQDKGNDDLLGNVSLTMDFYVDEKLVKKIQVSGRVSVKREVFKAARKVERGHIITSEDISEGGEDTVRSAKDLIVNREDIIGKRAVRTIQADQIIAADMLQNPPSVKKGDKVVIKAESSNLKITASGEALQDGQTGDQVQVLNTQSGKKIFATVKGSGVVEVFF